MSTQEGSGKAAQVVQFGGARATVRQRADGLWMVRWREAKVGRSTTSTTEQRALELARKKVRELAGKSGARLVSVLEAEAVDGLKEIAGGRGLTAVVEQLKDVVGRTGGWTHLMRAAELYVRAGHGKVLRTPAKEAVARFVALHERSATLYQAGLRKELEAFAGRFPDLAVCDLEAGVLEAWIRRPNEDGSDPGARYLNNRLATWKTFLNRCREWGLLVRGEPHPGELIKRAKEADRVPEIWTVGQATQILETVREHLPQSLNFVVIGCWMGLRPFEMHRLKWTAWDWERGYVDVGAHVALKTMQQRFVPIPENVRQLLHGRHVDPRWGVRWRRRAKTCVRSGDQVYVSALLRERGLIQEWPQDVMRHSYISYRLAQGHGRGQVAEWAGNSEGEIRRSYRRPLRLEDGEAWFRIGLGSGLG